ncbi:MAG: hypothetical protein AABX33_03695 [Nanoarchaeota archaeon]
MTNVLTKAIEIAHRMGGNPTLTSGANGRNGNVQNLDAIAGSVRASKFIMIFDEVTAYNNLTARGKPVYDEKSPKVVLDRRTLETIAMHLCYEPNKTNGCVHMRIGSNTLVYKSRIDYTNPSKPIEWSDPKHLFVMIPRGARINKTRYNEGEWVPFQDFGLQDTDKKTFSTLLDSLGYGEKEAEEISKYFTPANPIHSDVVHNTQSTNLLPIVTTPTARKYRTKVLAAILAASLIATLVSQCQKPEYRNTPQYFDPFRQSVGYETLALPYITAKQSINF